MVIINLRVTAVGLYNTVCILIYFFLSIFRDILIREYYLSVKNRLIHQWTFEKK